ncbi:hypothetical protein [Haloarchaeobius sp. TZWSO28]|uniref:hypothetical protein n=1 Tax=Haloarchaeobius sp. TZWSO28 TaxID=3446119 RepID=UPI003EBF6A10
METDDPDTPGVRWRVGAEGLDSSENTFLVVVDQRGAEFSGFCCPENAMLGRIYVRNMISWLSPRMRVYVH